MTLICFLVTIKIDRPLLHAVWFYEICPLERKRTNKLKTYIFKVINILFQTLWQCSSFGSSEYYFFFCTFTEAWHLRHPKNVRILVINYLVIFKITPLFDRHFLLSDKPDQILHPSFSASALLIFARCP